MHRTRLILLGASNLTRGISTVIETARLRFGSPLQVVAALGHGRSYGMQSRVLGRTLPGILESGLWRALNENSNTQIGKAARGESDSGSGKPPTFALITDIGNDIMYGASPQQITDWVDQCIVQLKSHGATIAITMLPIDSIRAIRRWQYTIVKAALFPNRQISFEQALARSGALHDMIEELALRHGISAVHQRGEWYGFDPIHIRFRHWPIAWDEIIRAIDATASATAANDQLARRSLRRWATLRRAMPERFWLFGRPFHRPQPSAQFPDGTTISLF